MELRDPVTAEPQTIPGEMAGIMTGRTTGANS